MKTRTDARSPGAGTPQALLGPYASWPYTERRSGRDRRARPTPFFNSRIFRGKRSRGRRRGERDGIYVDRFDRRDVVLAVTILVLNILDAGLTLSYLGAGGEEANPIARFVLEEWGDGVFLFTKVVVIGVCLLFLTMHKTFRHVRPAMRLLLVSYGMLLLYHLYLQACLVLNGRVAVC